MPHRLFLIFHGRFPSEKAASLFAAKSAEAFAQKGLHVTLVVPRRKGALEADPFQYYGVKKIFSVEYLPAINFFGVSFLEPMAFWLSYLSFSISTFLYLKNKSSADDVIYSNEILPLIPLSYLRRNTFYEMHDFPESKIAFFGWMLKRMRWVLVHNKWKMEELAKRLPQIPREKYLYEANAVDMQAFDIPMSKEEARAKLSLPSKKLVVYTGHLYGWKGVDTLAEAVQFLSDDYHVIFVGGTTEDVLSFRKKYGENKKISIVGHVSHGEIPFWQKAADVLVLPNTAKDRISAFYTSPMKLFEYMASSRPIVATNIPSLREIVSEANAFIAMPDNGKDLAATLVTATEEPSRDSRAAQALRDVADHTWEKRAGRIVAFMDK